MYPEEPVREIHTPAFTPRMEAYEYTYTNTQFLHLSQLYLKKNLSLSLYSHFFLSCLTHTFKGIHTQS